MKIYLAAKFTEQPCTHWDYGNDQCGKFKAKPPTDVIVYSCESYEDDDDIPF